MSTRALWLARMSSHAEVRGRCFGYHLPHGSPAVNLAHVVCHVRRFTDRTFRELFAKDTDCALEILQDVIVELRDDHTNSTPIQTINGNNLVLYTVLCRTAVQVVSLWTMRGEPVAENEYLAIRPTGLEGCSRGGPAESV